VGTREPFWFAFAAGTIGGLVLSLPGIFLFFPAFLKLGSASPGRLRQEQPEKPGGARL